MVWGQATKDLVTGSWVPASLGSGVADGGDVCHGKALPLRASPRDKVGSTSDQQGVWKSLLLLCPVWCVSGFVLASWLLANWSEAASQSHLHHDQVA